MGFSLTYDANGDRVRLGRVIRTIREPLFTTGLPSWLTVAKGTGSQALPSASAGIGGYTVTTAATSGSGAALSSTITPYMGNYDEIRWTVEGFYCDGNITSSSQATFFFGLYVGGNGGYFKQDQSAAQGYLHGGSTDQVNVPYNVTNGGNREAAHRRNLSLLLYPKRKELYLMEDDQVFGAISCPTLNPSAVVTPTIEVDTMESAVHSFTVSQVSLELVHN